MRMTFFFDTGLRLRRPGRKIRPGLLAGTVGVRWAVGLGWVRRGGDGRSMCRAVTATERRNTDSELSE